MGCSVVCGVQSNKVMVVRTNIFPPSNYRLGSQYLEKAAVNASFGFKGHFSNISVILVAARKDIFPFSFPTELALVMHIKKVPQTEKIIVAATLSLNYIYVEFENVIMIYSVFNNYNINYLKHRFQCMHRLCSVRGRDLYIYCTVCVQ